MDYPMITMVMIPEKEWNAFRQMQSEILEHVIKPVKKETAGVAVKYITAIEFMEAVRIKRSKFDQLVQASKIKILKKGRKIYVPVGEIERFFNDRTIQ